MIFRYALVALLLGYGATVSSRDGHPDPNFGVGGAVELPPTIYYPRPLAALVDAQDRVLVAGLASSGGLRGFVMRLLPSGALDTTFASNGWFLMPDIPALGFEPNTRTIFAAIAIDAAGIYVAGYPKGGNLKTCALVVALNDSGALRTGFGTAGSGAVCGPDGLPLGQGATLDRFTPRIGLVVTSQQILVSVVRIAGDYYAYPKAEWLYALTHSGTADAGFANQGLLTLPTGFVAGGLTLDAQSRLLVTGDDNLGLAFERRNLPQGGLDPTFGVLGHTSIAYPDYGYYGETGESWSMLGDRPTVGFRKYRDLNGVLGGWNYGFLRVTTDGAADTAVAPIPADTNTGYVTHPTLDLTEPTGWFDTAAARDPFQRVVIAGPELVRLLPDGNLDTRFATGGYVDLPQPRNDFSNVSPGRYVQQSIATDRAGNVFVVTSEFASEVPYQRAFRVMKFVGDTLLEADFE